MIAELLNGDLKLSDSSIEEFEATLQNGNVNIENSQIHQVTIHLQNGIWMRRIQTFNSSNLQ
ncbi:DUF4097 family beta strand repeat-containing protein [Streptococcus caprae]|uniref:DUF4097 family beta strand repeat-containing protein n=1 Tax=Streptococcus caprae TaxID=1640501 RepID=A0ABV8CUH4_9STRE